MFLSVECSLPALTPAGTVCYTLIITRCLKKQWHPALEKNKQTFWHTSHFTSDSVANSHPRQTPLSQQSRTLQSCTLNTGAAVPAVRQTRPIIKPDVSLIVTASLASRHPAVTASGVGEIYVACVCMGVCVCVCDVQTVKTFLPPSPLNLPAPGMLLSTAMQLRCVVMLVL